MANWWDKYSEPVASGPAASGNWWDKYAVADDAPDFGDVNSGVSSSAPDPNASFLDSAWRANKAQMGAIFAGNVKRMAAEVSDPIAGLLNGTFGKPAAEDAPELSLTVNPNGNTSLPASPLIAPDAGMALMDAARGEPLRNATLRDLQQSGLAQARAGGAELQQARTDMEVPESGLERYAKLAAISAGPTLAGMTAGIVTKSPAVGAGVSTLFAVPSAYGEARDAGHSVEDAIKYAGVVGGAEVVSERLGFDALLGKLATRLPAGKLATVFGTLEKSIPGRALTGAGVEGTTEALSQAAQNAYKIAGLGEHMTFDEFMTDMKDSFGAGAMIGGPLAGGHAAAQSLAAQSDSGSEEERIRRSADQIIARAERIQTPESDAVDAGRETARAIFAEAGDSVRPDPRVFDTTPVAEPNQAAPIPEQISPDFIPERNQPENVPEAVLDNSPEFSNQNRARIAELEAKPEPTLFEREELALLKEGKTPFDRQLDEPVAPVQSPTPSGQLQIGSPLANGFYAGPGGYRYRVAKIGATGGIALEKRSPSGDHSSFYVGKDGNLIDADDISLNRPETVERLWKPNEDQAAEGLAILQEMGALELSDPKRKELKARLRELVAEKPSDRSVNTASPFDRQALLADLESAPEPELIRNGTRVFYPGDVTAMRAKLAEAGLSEGMRMTGEDGADVGLYFPARLRAEVDAVLRPKPAEQAQPEPVKEGELPYRELGIPPPRKPRNRVKSAADFDPNYHDIRDFIALNGGLDAKAFAAEFNSEVPSPAENFRFFGKPLFRKSGGLQPDQLRELLQETGFLNPDSMDGVARYTPQDAYDLVDLALDGNPVYHPDGVDTQNAIQNYNNEYADLLRRQEYIDEHGVTPELDEEFARRADAMDRGDLEPVFSKRAKDRTATPDMFGATQRAQTTPTPRPASGDLFGAPTPRDRLDAAQRDSDARLTGPAVGMRQGDGELFAGPRPRQETIPPRSSSAPSDPTSWILRDKATGKAVMETADRRKVDALNTQKYEAVPAEQHMQEVNTKGTLAYDAARGSGIKRSQRPAERILPVEDMRTAPLGAWVRGNKVPGVREADLFQVMDVPLDRINAPELDSSDNIAPERRLDAEDYTNRLRNGEVAPNARGYELPSGLIKLADGHRRMIAARNAGRDTLRIAVSPIDQEGVKQRLERPDAQGIEVDEATPTPEEMAAFNRQVDNRQRQPENRANDAQRLPADTGLVRRPADGTTAPERAGMVSARGNRDSQSSARQVSPAADAKPDLTGQPPKFGQWFRQSKMKDAKARPMEFHHATDADFDTFDAGKRGSSTGFAPTGLGNWFSQDAGAIKGYGSKVLSGHLRLENPKVMDSHELPDLETKADYEALAKKYKAEGHDGLYFPDSKQAVAFDSVQFKENRNSGEYSESPNIYRSQHADNQSETPQAKDAKDSKDAGKLKETSNTASEPKRLFIPEVKAAKESPEQVTTKKARPEELIEARKRRGNLRQLLDCLNA